MQTFLPYASFEETAQVLDSRRLGKQRVEASQILKIITTPDYLGAWRHHPAVMMWHGYATALREYLNTMLTEWERRGYKNMKLHHHLDEQHIQYPWWLGDPRLHDSHKSNLLRKDWLYYSQFGWEISDDIPYYWPVTYRPPV